MFIRLPDGFRVNPDLIFAVGPGQVPNSVVLYSSGERKHTVIGYPQSAVVACLGEGWAEKPFEPDPKRTDAEAPPANLTPPKEIVCCRRNEVENFLNAGWRRSEIVMPTITHLEGRRYTKAWVTQGWLEIMGLGNAWDLLVRGAIATGGSIEIVTTVPAPPKGNA